MSRKSEVLPATVPERISLVGTTCFGRDHLRKVADGLGISRTTLWEIMRGHGKRRDIDAELIELLSAEHDASTQRGIEIDALRRRFLATRRQSDAAL